MDIKSPSSLKSMCLNALANNSKTSAEKAAELLNLTHSLTISIGENRLPFVRTAVSGSDIEMIPSVILLANKDGTTRLPVSTITANNVLFFDSIDSDTVEKLLELYPDIVKLTFVNYGSIQHYAYLEKLLRSAKLKNQLHSFTLIDKQRESYDSPGLFHAINNLASLKDLNLDLSAIRMYDLQVLATLKTFKYNGMMRHCRSLLKSLKLYAILNVNDLKIDIVDGNTKIRAILELGEVLCNRFVRISQYKVDCRGNLMTGKFCAFKNIRSLSLKIFGSHIRYTFSILATLKRLAHLGLHIDFTDDEKEEDQDVRSMFSFDSTQALTLGLNGITHSKLKLLDFSHTFPNAEGIHITDMNCKDCLIDISKLETTQGQSEIYVKKTRNCITNLITEHFPNTSPLQIAFNWENFIGTVDTWINANI